MEPIKIKATPVPVAKEVETEPEEDSEVETFEKPEAVETPAEPAAPGPRKKRRRAASSGIITPGSGSNE
jgi:hypothetical protein